MENVDRGSIAATGCAPHSAASGNRRVFVLAGVTQPASTMPFLMMMPASVPKSPRNRRGFAKGFSKASTEGFPVGAAALETTAVLNPYPEAGRNLCRKSPRITNDRFEPKLSNAATATNQSQQPYVSRPLTWGTPAYPRSAFTSLGVTIPSKTPGRTELRGSSIFGQPRPLSLTNATPR